MTRRTFGSCIDLTGDTFWTLYVERPVSTKPSPRYQVRCTRCGTSGIMGQAQILTARYCPLNATCYRRQEYEARFPKQPTYEPIPAIDPAALTVPGPYPDF